MGSPVAAQVVLDGTTGPGVARPLEGPAYLIGDELGTRAGANLFHSFERFGLHTGESATFSGPESIANVISRVTGGERSDIDGTLRSTIPGAALWFLNPAGVVFGPNARLDLQGSFHVSTADELRFADGARFSATDPTAGRLTVAAPEAFGFLGARPAAGIAVDGSALAAPPGEALSLVGGGIGITGGPEGIIRAEAGRVTLAALGGAGEARIEAGEVATGTAADISLSEQALVDVSGGGGGTVRIRAGRFVVESSRVVADNTGPRDGAGGIDLQAEEVRLLSGSVLANDARGSGRGGRTSIAVDRLEVRDGSAIGAATFGAGDAGGVSVTAGRVVIAGDGSPDFTGITSQASFGSSGNAGVVTVTAPEIRLADRGQISSSTSGSGAGGDVTINASSRLAVDNAFIGANTFGAADAGSVFIDAGHLEFVNEGRVFNGTDGAGKGGDITVVADTLVADETLDHVADFHTGISASANFGSTGAGGAVTVSARKIGLVNGGNVVVLAREELFISGVDPVGRPGGVFANSGNADADARGGTVLIGAPVITIADGAEVASSSQGGGVAGTISVGNGDVGAVEIRHGAGLVDVFTVPAVGDLRLSGGSITAETARADAGDIRITAVRLVDLEDGEVTTSAAGGAGGGGNISIDPRFVVLNNSRIVAQAAQGRGGDIRIVADNFISSADSVISASAGPAGIDGTVEISAPEQDVGGGLVALPASFVDAAALLPASCAVRGAAAVGRFTTAGRGGLPAGPDAPLPGRYADLAAFNLPIPAGGDGGRRADELLRRAEADLRAGFHGRAIATLEAALPVAEAAGDRVRLAALSGALGAARLAAGAPGEARLALARSLQLAHETGDAALEAATLLNVGNALAGAAGEDQAAAEAGPALGAYDGAAELALSGGRPDLAARAGINAARLLARRGEGAAAAERARAALAELARAPADDPERPLELVVAGLALAAAGAANEAAIAFERAAALAEAQGDGRAGSYALGELGALDAAAGRPDDALRLTRRALFLAQAADAPEALYRWQWQAGRLLAEGGETDAAITAYEGAVGTLQAVRADLPAFDPATGRSLFRQTVGPVFLELADLLLQRAAGEEDAAARRPGLVRARGVVENLKSAELADYFKAR